MYTKSYRCNDHLTVMLCGTPTDWRVRLSRDRTKPLYTQFSDKITSHIAELLAPYSVTELLLPSTFTCGNKGAPSSEFIEKTEINGITIRTHPSPLDVCDIPPGCAGAIAPADCRTLLLQSKEKLVIAHASLNGLLEMEGFRRSCLVHPGTLFEQPVESVVSRSIGMITETGTRTEDLHAYSFLGISLQGLIYPPYHPEHGERNKQVLKYLKKLESSARLGDMCLPGKSHHIDLCGIITAQLKRSNVPLEHITHCSHHTDIELTPERERFRWHSYRRSRGSERNLVLAVHHR